MPPPTSAADIGKGKGKGKGNDEIEGGDVVWVSATGKCYHAKKRCGNLKTARASTVEAAEAASLTRCHNCW